MSGARGELWEVVGGEEERGGGLWGMGEMGRWLGGW